MTSAGTIEASIYPRIGLQDSTRFRHIYINPPSYIVGNTPNTIFQEDMFPFTLKAPLEHPSEVPYIIPYVADLKDATHEFRIPGGYQIRMKPLLYGGTLIVQLVVGRRSTDATYTASQPFITIGSSWYDNSWTDYFMMFGTLTSQLVNINKVNRQVGTDRSYVSSDSTLTNYIRQMILVDDEAVPLLALWYYAVSVEWNDARSLPFFSGDYGPELYKRIVSYIDDHAATLDHYLSGIPETNQQSQEADSS